MMRMNRTILAVAGLVWGCASARPARAQTAADTAALVRATATVLADSVVPRSRNTVVFSPPNDAFGTAVADSLRDRLAMHRGANDPAESLEVHIRLLAIDGDTARVVVGMSQEQHDGGGNMAIAIQRDDYVFQRTGDG